MSNNFKLKTVFWQGAGKKSECPGFYLGLDANGVGAHAGLHAFTKPVLEAYRQAVLAEKTGTALAAILAELETQGQYTFSEMQYKRVPAGYDADHPRAALLRYKGLYASSPVWPAAAAGRPGFMDACFAHYENMAPLQQWLVNVYDSAST